MDFFRSVCLSGRERCIFFLSEKDPKLVPSVQRYIHHSTLRKNCSFQKNSGAHFFCVRSVFQKCRCRRFDSCKLEKSSLRADLERTITYINLSQETAERIELTSLWFHFWSHPMLPLPESTNTSPIQTQSACEERDRETL